MNIETYLRAFGFTNEYPSQEVRTFDNGITVCATVNAGCPAPEETDWLICVYRGPVGADLPILTLSSEEIPPELWRAAIDAAVAFAERAQLFPVKAVQS